MYAILSDIHGNMIALERVINDMRQYEIEGIILLGDLIDYGMKSNEVIEFLQNSLDFKIICNIWGNHEKAILSNDFSCFSSSRGVECAQYTQTALTNRTKDYLTKELLHEGMMSFELDGKKLLAIHGSLVDHFWKSIEPGNLNGDYSSYDVVLSGHSHCSHFFTKYYENNDNCRRNKHAVTFINPGSVGQPRNHNPNSQYALLDMKNCSVWFRSIDYNISEAMRQYNDNVDVFYRDRLIYGV
jgi:putative phosphoesterase